MYNPYILEEDNQLLDLIEMSKNPEFKGVLVFKHSTRCSVSYMAQKGLKSQWNIEDVPLYYLDLIKFRALSNQIANQFGVKHESPQLLFIKNGVCTHHASHFNVNVDTIQNWINA